MNKKILASMILIGLLGAAAGIGTWAYYSSTRTENPGFYTANLNLELGVDKDWGTVLDNMAPGDDREQVFRLSTSEGSIDGSYSELEISYEVPMPTIDGVISPREWGGALSIPVADGTGTVKLLANADYLYVLFDVKDSTDARLGENIHGNDQTSININPTEGAPWGLPCEIIFQTGADPAAWGGVSCGMTDGWYTDWKIDGVQKWLPGDLETKTVYTDPRDKRVSEWKIPLGTLSHHSPGDTLKAGGAIDVGDGHSYVYPIGLDWSDASTYVPCIIKGDIGEVITVKVKEWDGSNWILVHKGSTLKQWNGWTGCPQILAKHNGVGAVKITLHFDESAGNEYQGIHGNICFTFTLWQGP